MKSVMNHSFSMAPQAEISRSKFDRSHGYKTTFDEGYLVPFFLDEVLPGDTFNLETSLLCRMATPIAPIMDNIFLDTFYFFVPNRLVWDNWEKFNGQQDNPGDSTDYLVPTLADGTEFEVGSLGDYFGIPTGVALDEINALPFRAYNLIYNEWFRDENLQDSLPVPKDDGSDVYEDNYALRRRGKRHDYFTSALPWPQKGPGVEIPLGTTASMSGHAPVVFGGVYPLAGGSRNSSEPFTGLQLAISTNTANSNSYSVDPRQYASSSSPSMETVTGFANNASPVFADLSPGIVDLTSATAATINSLRQAFQLQRLFERDARGGTRYTEIIRSHFGVVSPDARLQRPEYLGGSSTRININPVVQTSSTDSTTPQGNLSAFGVLGDTKHGFSKSFTEHGYIIGLVNVRADLTYQQGLNRIWSRRTRFDYYWPVLAHLGEQAILNKEIYAQGNSKDEEVFGYQERYAEYRYFPSIITGKFRSTYSQPLDSWHLSQKFDSLPTLSGEFIEDKPPISRVVAVPSEPHFLLDTYFNLKCIRPMPLYGIPGLFDHF